MGTNRIALGGLIKVRIAKARGFAGMEDQILITLKFISKLLDTCEIYAIKFTLRQIKQLNRPNLIKC